MRATVLSPQLGTYNDPNPAARPEHGRAPVEMVATIRLAVGSMRVTVFFGAFDTHTESSTAIQSGAPGISNVAMGSSFSTGILTPGVATPGLGFGAGRGAPCCAAPTVVNPTAISRQAERSHIADTSSQTLDNAASLFGRRRAARGQGQHRRRRRNWLQI